MAANVSGEYRIFRYYEGLCSSGDFPKEIAKVLALGVKTKAVYDLDGKVIGEPSVIRNKNWDIVYPAPGDTYDLDNLTTEEYVKKIEDQVNKITDTVILKTTTTPKDIEVDNVDDLTIDNDTNKTSLTMYLEIYHPTYLADPEQYPLDCERKGIIPKLITKEMYQAPYEVTVAVEEPIYTNEICKVEHCDDTSVGSKDMTYDECDKYVSKFNNIFGDTRCAVPSQSGTSTNFEINSAYLTKIKQNDSDLYNLLLNYINSEGIEPKEYTALNSVRVEIMREANVYTMIFESVKSLTIYTIPQGSSYNVAHKPLDRLIPELSLDGIYIPISSDSFHTDGNTIYFDKEIVFEASTDGVLVIRYNYEHSSDDTIFDRTTLLNNHYVLMRMFDHINDEHTGPKENVYNSNGEVIKINSHISPWSKLSWYQDFEEVMVDTIDSDIATNNIHDGTLYVPLETVGLNADTKIRYWINTNNDRFSLIVMGNPSMDYERDRHLISACYCGRIDSFERPKKDDSGFINDTAGNFALFTSSSTEPCDTTLTMEESPYPLIHYELTEDMLKNNNYDTSKLEQFKKSCPWHSPCVPAQTGTAQVYYIQLSDKTYFDRTEWPRYVIVNEQGMPISPCLAAFKRNFVIASGKSDLLELTIDTKYAYCDSTYTIYVTFGYYKEKYVLNSGVVRDVFGNIVNVEKVKDYGVNTSDGVTSISMYHTRSKAYYQKHHMLYATTEEYMSKVMYGKSSYTGEYYADRIKVTHSNDGPRGILSDLLVIDSNSLYAMDELVINKDFEKDDEQYEETFVYFPITAPYSPLSDSPNSLYGFAIKKEEREPVYTDENKILQIAGQQLDTIAANFVPVTKDIGPDKLLNVTANGCTVNWELKSGSVWYDVKTNKRPDDETPLRLAVKNTKEYQGSFIEVDGEEVLDTITPVEGIIVTPMSKEESESDYPSSTDACYIRLAGFNIITDGPSDQTFAYGISDTEIPSIGRNAKIKACINDGLKAKDGSMHDNSVTFEYNIEDMPFVSVIGELNAPLDPDTPIRLVGAHPDKYLILYDIDYTQIPVIPATADMPASEATVPTYSILQYACIPLNKANTTESKNALLRYPCTFSITTEGGKGTYSLNKVDGHNTYINAILPYDSTAHVGILADSGYAFKKATIVDSDTGIEIDEITTLSNITVGEGVTMQGIDVSLDRNKRMNVIFEPVTTP